MSSKSPPMDTQLHLSAALVFTPLLQSPINLPINLPKVPNVYQIAKNWFTWLLNSIIGGFLDALNVLFTLGFDKFLFYPNPRTIPVLDTLWQLSFAAFAVMAGISFLYILLMASYFPGTDSADLQYHLERVTKYFIVVFISRDVIGFGVAFTHTLTATYYKPSFDLSIGISIVEQMIMRFGPFMAFQLGLVAVAFPVLKTGAKPVMTT